jgi:ubiquinone/menaquinone biosynthesis C-methylase UbiE
MIIDSDWIPWRKYIQNQEFKIFCTFLPKSNLNILEIGGGDGMKSMLLDKLGHNVICVDIEPWQDQFFSITKIKNNELPFESNSFDVILSSHVIPHVKEKNLLFNEINRVLNSNGIILHEVPSCWWSLFTNFLHYLQIPKFILKSIFKNKSKNNLNSDKIISNQKNSSGSKFLTLKKLFTHPLGNNKSFIHELFYFQKSSWKSFFIKNDYRVLEIKNNNLFFTGFGIFKNRFLHLRYILSIIFPSAYYFKLEKY